MSFLAAASHYASGQLMGQGKRFGARRSIQSAVKQSHAGDVLRRDMYKMYDIRNKTRIPAREALFGKAAGALGGFTSWVNGTLFGHNTPRGRRAIERLSTIALTSPDTVAARALAAHPRSPKAAAAAEEAILGYKRSARSLPAYRAAERDVQAMERAMKAQGYANHKGPVDIDLADKVQRELKGLQDLMEVNRGARSQVGQEAVMANIEALRDNPVARSVYRAIGR